MNGKKGGLFDILTILVLFFSIAMTILFLVPVLTGLNTEVQDSNTITTLGKSYMTRLNNDYSNIWDKGALILLVSLWLGSVFGVSQLDSNKVFFIFFTIGLVVYILVAAILANTWYGAASDPNLVAAANQLPIMGWIFSHYTIITVVIGFSIAVALYAKVGGDNSGVAL